LTAHSPEWAAGLHAAMLRDTLDGLLSVDADEYIVFAAATPGEDVAPAYDALARHVPAPWRIETARGATQDDRLVAAFEALAGSDAWAIVVAADAPTAPTEPIAELLAKSATGAALGPSEADAWLVATTAFDPSLVRELPWQTPALADAFRVRCAQRALALHELPAAHAVRHPSDVLLLLEELRKAPERAPRTAQFLLTKGG
jgi:glycosyltransferase A (GT-A) superfamily protein (DUF2064 family)